jgi:hypothetical protein
MRRKLFVVASGGLMNASAPNKPVEMGSQPAPVLIFKWVTF